VKQGDVDAVVELPAQGDTAKAPVVVLLQEYWGLNENILAQAKRWAAEGFVVVVPDLYHGKLAQNAIEAGAWLEAFDWGKGIAEIGACIEYGKTHERSTGKIVVTGYCMGGALTLGTAVNVRGLACAISYYGHPGEMEWSKIDAPVQAHVATHDDWVKPAMIEKIKETVSVPFEIYVYEAQHAFCNEKRPEVYDADACKLAWSRSVEFANKHAR
jgi:carboxymethylenebutenolidase